MHFFRNIGYADQLGFEKVPIETEKVPIDNLSTQLRSIFQFVKENGRFIEYNKISRRADLCVR